MFALYIASFLTLASPITPHHTYNGVANGIMIDVELPDGVDVGHLVLVDHQNNPLATPSAVIGGTHNLIGRIPAIKDLTRAAWIQFVVDDLPYGSPLVVQPMTSRMVPVVEDATRPDGKTTYTKIIGWRDEAEDDGIVGSLVSGWRVYVDSEVLIKTSKGNIRIALRPDAAPNTVWNFRELAMGGFYRGTTFHRIVPMTSKGFPFVIQGGDPTGTGSGGPGWWLPIEQSSLQHDFGVISMARANDPDSAGSQFFLCLSREGTARLDGQYCAFGETITGEEVIGAIASTPLSDPSLGKPVEPPVINSVHLVAAPPRQWSR